MATLKEIHDAQLQMLTVYHNFCDENALHYFLSAGTLLGAIRHKGFIPWDDDVDVCMPLRDLKILRKKFNSSRLFVQCPETERKTPFVMDKIRLLNSHMPDSMITNLSDFNQGLWIDIFPYVNAGRTPFKKKLQVFLLRCLQSYRCRYLHLANGEKRLILSLFCNNRATRMELFIDNLLGFLIECLGSKKSDEYFLMDVGTVYFYKKYLFDARCLCSFEDERLYGLHHYDEYLSMIYGDYMTPRRWSHLGNYTQVHINND